MIEQFLQKYSLHGNWVDLIFILLILYFIFSSRGFINSLIEAGGFIFALIFSYKIYSIFGQLLISNFSFPRGLAFAAGYFIAWFLSEIIFYFLISLIPKSFFENLSKHPLNTTLGFITGAFQASIIYLFFVSLIFAFPVRPQIKEAVLNSRTGPFFVDLSQSFERQTKSVFGEAISETLNFLTIKPDSTERIDLGFKPPQDKLSNDASSENIMFDLVNQERQKDNKKELVFDDKLRDLARSYGMQMFSNGFFSHVSAVDGSSPSDRANGIGVSYTVIGENLAFAPDVYVAHQGLMNSQGHRENILSSDYSKVGIGVIDGGIYGRIFVQEFTN